MHLVIYILLLHIYSYDIEGSVKTLVQEYPVLDSVGQRYKRVDYDYDLISGKVNMLSYNRSFPDQYYQRYSYDDDNRITKVETSSDGYIWRRDAAYTYYQHGPLARTELGDLRVQGLDYAYTIQGWLKAVNGDTASMALDMGRDGDLTVNGKDAMGFSLNYFKDDYKAISGTAVSSVAPQTRNLYNGNIARQTIAYAIDSQRRAPFPRLTRQYMYDQMNRLRSTNNGHVSATDQSVTGTQEYYSDYTYDPDGNLKTLNRYAGIKLPYTTPFLMDSFNYYYTPTSNNELRSLTDNAADIGVQDVKYRTDSTILTYLYDLTGNTIKDLVAGQDSIEWNLYNKVVHTRNVDPTVTMSFKYDGMGNRVSKTVTHDDGTSKEENTEYYVHDASGNILATYHEDRLKKPSTFTDTRIFSLSGHDIYGSSRLGTRGYWPLQVGQKWDYYYGLYDTIRLSERKPWYSLEYQDNINHNDQTPYGNTFALPSVNSHMTGQKQYEVTDHLGDVLATVSDARGSRGFAASPTDSFGIAGYAPAIMSQHDYYPFGMQMPDRNYEDVGGHSTTVTQTVLAPQLHPWTIIWGDGLATAIGSGVVGSGSPLVLSAPTPGGGLVYNLHPVSAGLDTRVVIKVSAGASSAWVAQVKQGTNSTSSHYLSTTGDHTITFNFPISGTAQLYITQASNVGPISIAKITLDTFAFIPTTAVSQISSGNEYKYGFNGKMKDDEWSGVGNFIDFGARGFDTRTARWISTDPLTQEYPKTSPYVFCLNNPIIFYDGDGRVVLGSDGKPVTYSKDNNGLITWSSNATADVKKVGGAMIKTPTGEAAFNRWQSASTEVTVVVDYNNNMPDKIADTKPSLDEDGKGIINDDGQYERITVTIYDKEVQSVRSPESEDRFRNSSEEEVYGAVGTHEEGHNNSKQIKRDIIKPNEVQQDKKRTIPFHQEIDCRREYHELNPGQPNDKTWEDKYKKNGYDTNKQPTEKTEDKK